MASRIPNTASIAGPVGAPTPVRRRAGVTLAATALAASTLSLGAPASGAELLELPLYEVAQEGMTPDQAARLAEAAGVGNALRPDGSFGFTDSKRFATVPSKVVGRGVDESERATVSQAIDFAALKEITTLPGDKALGLARELLALPKAYGAEPVVGHTTFEQADARGRRLLTHELDTTVSYRLDLGGVPVVGPGARARVSLGGDGEVLALAHAVRDVRRGDTVKVITPKQAIEHCYRLYGKGVEQREPELVYYAPALSARDASGKGRVSVIVPHYVCRVIDVPDVDELDLPKWGGRLIPAVPDLAPSVELKAAGDASSVEAAAGVRGGTEPYTFSWSSSSTALVEAAGEQVSFARNRRGLKDPERVTVTVTDANGLVTTASVTLPAGGGDGHDTGTPGGAGGELASVGIEQTVDEWQCAQDSANGFRDVMKAKGHTVKFDWRGWSAWERDFKRTALGGTDSSYVDSVDAQWYTGHGSPGGFTFKSSVNDTSIVPNDAQWGNDYNLEWMQLESCQVLRDVTGTLDHFARWAPAFDGLHLLNGFHTNAWCIGGGTGRRFAEYLFPEKFLWWELRPAYTVVQAWGSMAADLEPAGTRWRSISPAGAGWVTNLGDHFWGQGSVGPDIPASARVGWVSISGVA